MAGVFVPFVTRVLRALGTFQPGAYEPKDTTRLLWLAERARQATAMRGEGLVNAVAFVLLGLLWLAIMRARR